MAELLLEIFSEEIPARMQAKAAKDLGRMLGDALKSRGFAFDGMQTFAGPRRLTAVIADLPVQSPDVREERKGPRTSAPEQAIAGFLRGAGLDSLDACEQREDKKGAYWVAVIEKPGQQATDALAEIMPKLMADFPWPKSMKWGSGTFRWVRPVHRIVCLLDGEVVSFEVAGIQSGNETEGHRFMGRGPYMVKDFADYRAQLEGPGKVVLDAADRKARISEQIAAICAKHDLELVPDAALLDEVTGLAEWPVVLLGDMKPEFLELPPEVIQLSMAKHQKYFSVRGKDGKLAPHFLVVANLQAPDGGKAIAQGNARVLTARLADARHFWDTDRERTLDSRVDDLKSVVFHQKLGSVFDKAERMAKLAKEIAPLVGADPALAERAAKLAKADLTTQMVIEFTSLQGVMGRYYAAADGEDVSVADAVCDHYKPQGPDDAVPTNPVSVAVALADKLDTLVGFWAIDEKPTGSKDPYALRRAALGIIRIVLENGLEFPLLKQDVSADLLSFFHDRLKVYLRDQGARHDLIDAVITPEADDLLAIVQRVEALADFLKTKDGAQLLAGAKRAANIVRAEEKKQKGEDFGTEVDEKILTEPAEKALFNAVKQVEAQADTKLQSRDYTGAMKLLSGLRAPVDRFFDDVLVNVDADDVRRNRLALLNRIGKASAQIADFSRIEG